MKIIEKKIQSAEKVNAQNNKQTNKQTAKMIN